MVLCTYLGPTPPWPWMFPDIPLRIVATVTTTPWPNCSLVAEVPSHNDLKQLCDGPFQRTVPPPATCLSSFSSEGEEKSRSHRFCTMHHPEFSQRDFISDVVDRSSLKMTGCRWKEGLICCPCSSSKLQAAGSVSLLSSFSGYDVEELKANSQQECVSLECNITRGRNALLMLVL